MFLVGVGKKERRKSSSSTMIIFVMEFDPVVKCQSFGESIGYQ